MSIMNLTQHAASPEQKEAGVFDLPSEALSQVRDLITFRDLPSSQEMKDRAADVAAIAASLASPDDRDDPEGGFALEAMIGGAGFFMRHLEDALNEQGIKPIHAFSQRVVEETIGDDGAAVKTARFKHLGFIRP